MMKKNCLPSLCLALTAVTFNSVSYAGPVSTSDLWQYDGAGGSNGSRVTSDSGSKRPGIELASDIFGTSSGFEAGSFIFKDYFDESVQEGLVPDGYVHWVEWSTDASVNLLSFNLHAANEKPEDPSPARSFSRFTLFSGDGNGNWTEFYDVFTNSLFETRGQNGFLDLEVDLAAPIVAQYFRAEFVGIRPTNTTIGNSGPRIQELDGFDTFLDGSTSATLTPVPIPAAIWLFGTSLVTLVGIGRKKRQNHAAGQNK